MSLPQPSLSPEEDDDVIVVPINRSFSDGDPSTWPRGEKYGRPDDHFYRTKLAELWLQKTGAYEPDLSGATPSANGIPVKRIGRPPGRPSTGRPVGRPPGRPSMGRPVGRPPTQNVARPVGRRPGRPPGRPAGATSSARVITDSEGTPDVFKMATLRLKARGTLDEPITEPESMDWRAERSGLEETLERTGLQPAFIPRAGEIVLYTLSFDGELLWNAERSCVEVFNPAQNQWLGRPEWRAGVVGQIPVEETVLQDIVDTAPKAAPVNYSGFRVETLPDPNASDKSYSLQYHYLYLKCIKPFNAYEYFLQGVARADLHPSIEYALTLSSSFSLLGKHRFKGTWPNASIHCRGIFIGAELLLVGDAVRLKPTFDYPEERSYCAVMDVMVIDEVWLELVHCNDDPKAAQLAEQYRVRIAGKIYTNNYKRARSVLGMGAGLPDPLGADEVVDVFQSIGMSGYGDWYRMWSGQTVEVSQDMVVGRCYEPEAMQLLFGSRHLGLDLAGVLKGRAYSRQADARIAEGKDWFWGDFRTQTLAIDTLNGEDVGHYSETRDVKMWRANLRVIDGTANPADVRAAKIRGEIGRPSKARSGFSGVGKISKLVSTGLGAADASNPVSSEEGASGGNDSSSEVDEEVYVARIDQLRGGTEETEEGDYTPEAQDGKQGPY
ncbi:conserved hypothetical protein [Aspergillus terreus NIH2624]|uniref:Cryptic loci regulator 2 C-terminal domain-containing protein n=1 Tax=Aspergillus terreus (strain NIH 2624 / FGSC A1156) TaxID=341663 RepID=Q0CUL4_ASPTN|nr:uncharacterized protein ATEG_02620 [Aspergillus terreus NIH2624]EAU37582.1 conserved hypothetical protein [Aspergillus terreus NIH2624]